MVTPDKRHCGLMDNLTPITTSAFDTINAELCQVSKSVTEYSMKSTMKNEIEPTATEYQESQHQLCPEGQSSWCMWQEAKANGNFQSFHNQNNITHIIIDVIKPIFTKLADPELLKRYVEG
ncbi:hypothetical protein TKK_0011561 [Trichogramma kaykai]